MSKRRASRTIESWLGATEPVGTLPIVTCYADPTALTDSARLRLRAFLHRLGPEANHGEVGIVIGDKYYGITRFDRESE
jgi:hypothetical protein